MQQALAASSGWRGANPVRGPFPDVADHVVEDRSRWPERRRPARCCDSRAGRFSEGNSPCQVFAMWAPARRELVAPGIGCAVEAARARQIPIPPRSAATCPPIGIGERIGIGDMDDRMIRQRAARPLRPVGDAASRRPSECPPLPPVAGIDAAVRLREDHRAGRRACAAAHPDNRRIRRQLGEGHIAGGFDEPAEIAIGNEVAVDEEAIDVDAVDRASSG